VGNTHEANSIEASKDGGWCCISDEAFVMKVERRVPIISSKNISTTLKEDD
jgi:hypothetical protein